MKTLFLITGAVCSGKTTLAKQIGNAFNMPIFNEDIYGTFENCLNNLKNCEQNYLLLEHCDATNNLQKLKNFNVKIFVLKVNNNLLLKNYENRKNTGATGDYLKINPLKQQADILNQASKLTCDIIEINNTADYELALNSISKSVALRLPKNISNKKVKHNLNIKQTKQFKDKYFAYYDDVKSNTHEVYDW